LFIVGKETEEGFTFPSDLDAAENLTNKKNVIQIDVEIIRSQMKFMNDAGRAESISTKSGILVDPSFEVVMEKARERKCFSSALTMGKWLPCQTSVLK